jgi:hypothetical protein
MIYSMTWKPSATPSGRLVFRLALVELPTLESDYGPLPTLTVHGNYNRVGASRTSGDGLHTALKRALPTHVADDTGHRRYRYAQGGTALSMALDGPLDPEWLEQFMGFPQGWTELEGSETP